MFSRHTARRAFTLVEILIVVVILGILAAIVIPQFTNASQEASAASTESQLQTIRSQIELFRVRHNGTLPDLLTNQWDELVDPTGEPPYLQDEPVNPFTGNSVIVAGTSHLAGASATDGWVWDATEGRLFAVGYDEDTNLYTEQ